MSRRQHRVEELLRREVAQMLLRGELRDPRLQPASAIGITGVEISGDLSVATIYVDVFSESLKLERVLAALRAAAGLIRSKLGDRLQVRRSPELRFAYDQAIARGARIEEILAEINEHPPSEPSPATELADPSELAEQVEPSPSADDEQG